MRLLCSHIDYARIGHFQSVLEEHGFEVFVKNLGASIAMGEIPYTEVWPELWLYDDSRYDEAMALLADLQEPRGDSAPWLCPSCGTRVEDGFEECWNCGAPKG